MKKLITLAALALGFTMSAQSIITEHDTFSDKITRRSPYTYSFGLPLPVTFTQVIRGQDTTTYLSLQTTGSTFTTSRKGVVVLLNNGEKILRNNEEVDMRINSDARYEYSAFFRIDKDELKAIADNGVKAFKLYIYECNLNITPKYNKKLNKKIQQYAKELL